jgi:hypothetical protein
MTIAMMEGILWQSAPKIVYIIFDQLKTEKHSAVK